MKKVILSILAVAVIGFAMAQSKFDAAMEKGISEVYKANSQEAFQSSANYFERISNAEKEEWLPNYYAAYALIMKAFTGAPADQQIALANKADEFLARAESLSPNNSEVSVLQSMVVVVYLQNDQANAMTLGPKATQIVQKAISQDAGNPRAYMQLAQMLYHTPTAFGGGKEPGLKALDKSIDAYHNFKPSGKFAPMWGEAYARQLKEEWSK